jgi:hypothetical protein
MLSHHACGADLTSPRPGRFSYLNSDAQRRLIPHVQKMKYIERYRFIWQRRVSGCGMAGA